MAYDEENAWVLWPEYFDQDRSRSEGRRVPLQTAVKKPTAELIAKSLVKLKLEHVVEADKSYPANWWGRTGRVRVERTMPKTQLIEQVGRMMHRLQRS